MTSRKIPVIDSDTRAIRRASRIVGTRIAIACAGVVADASHELRTPLAVLDARLQILQRALPTGDPSSSVVADLRSDAKDLIHIVNELLESAEIGGAAVHDTAVVDLVAAVDAAMQSMALIAIDKHITIELDAPQPGPGPVRVPASSITRCVVALLDNAVRFTPRDSAITVGVAVTKKTVAVTVRDRGPGIHGIDHARIFDRFAHSAPPDADGDEARTGFGIGLSLVREIAVRYGGSVHVFTSTAAGTALSLTVPRAKQTRSAL
ncbi:sensor histidine kinase [Cryobacterium gelidum]|uniref:histidine kinase n=1 Tax=Cryobacterium gelidum TaxID=1259164 RepID=A0A4R9AZQ2_9MICO|nr:HAMP domain-containing sensor histidine kinase [Cryobacterium gelidum]TFD73140.1 HAMP domain-containing histidine kinase [Cryobacterium gelidum]